MDSITGGRESERLAILGEKPEAELPRHALTSLNGRRRQDARAMRRPVSAFIHMSQPSALASRYPAFCDCLYRPRLSPGRQEFQHFMRGGGRCVCAVAGRVAPAGRGGRSRWPSRRMCGTAHAQDERGNLIGFWAGVCSGRRW